MKAAIFSGCFICLTIILTGCVSSIIAVSAASSGQEHSAYTDYLFATLERNKILIQQGQKTESIFPEDVWVEEIYRTKIAYAYYYDANRNSPNTIIPFDTWKVTEYPKWLEQQKRLTSHSNKQF